MTATEPTYAVIMNGSVTGEPDGVNITEYNLGVVTNGTVCDPTVRVTYHVHNHCTYKYSEDTHD